MITKKCELLAGDYLFLRDKLMGLQNDTAKLENKEQIQSLANSFILTFLGLSVISELENAVRDRARELGCEL